MMYGEWRWFADSALRFLIKSAVIIVDDLFWKLVGTGNLDTHQGLEDT
jgi:hypothetical protein